ncbi:hypothetical protein D3C78_1814370 [compost metagenome]
MRVRFAGAVTGAGEATGAGVGVGVGTGMGAGAGSAAFCARRYETPAVYERFHMP